MLGLTGSGNFVIVELPYEFDGDVVYVEGDTAQRISGGRDVVQQCTYIFNATLVQALPTRESQDLIRAVMETRTLIFDQHEMAAFIADAKNGDFVHPFN